MSASLLVTLGVALALWMRVVVVVVGRGWDGVLELWMALLSSLSSDDTGSRVVHMLSSLGVVTLSDVNAGSGAIVITVTGMERQSH